MRKVILLGTLGDKYGATWEMEADTYQEVFSCIEANYPSFRKTLIDIAEAGGDLDIQSGDKFLEVEDMFYPVDSDTIVITPIPSGAKSGGAKILAAIAITVAAFLILGPQGVAAVLKGSAGAFAQIGLQATFLLATNLAMVGIMQLLAPDPSVDTNDQDYLFSGPENTIAEGNVVPVLFGEMIVGGVTISSGIGASYGPSVMVGGTGRDFPLVNLGGFPVQFPAISFGITGITNISPFYPPTPNLTDNPITTPITIVVDTPYPAYNGTEAR
jgi:predicted phage tail protein